MFVGRVNNLASFGEKWDFLKHLVAMMAMFAHDRPLVMVKLSRFEQVRSGMAILPIS